MSSLADTHKSEMRELITSLRSIQLAGKSAITLEKTEPDYVLDIDAQTSSLSSNPLVAATSSNFTIRLFSKETLMSAGVISGHTDVISGVRFCQQDKNLLFSSSQDSVRCWDLRAPTKAVQTFQGFEGVSSITSFDLSCDGRVLCAGSEVNKDGMDRRHGDLLGCYSECHQDDITQVEFHPTQADSLLSGSTDGLVCVYDISQSSEEEALLSTLNSCSSVQKTGWCGSDKQNVYCVTHIDTFHVWNAFEGDNLIKLTDIKERTKCGCDMLSTLVLGP
ncbi:WD repeat-containing protein 89-like [Liolophura sinensis]|uniref:WD repeat-containing protein 89-like n=1 Tax=Liolophura sinensis TaxID=3198878 RepID=UPI003158613B